MLERAQGGRAGVRDVQPGPAQGRQQLGPRVGVETRRAERAAHLGDQRLEQLRPGAAGRPRPSRSVSRRSWTSTRHGTPAYVISAATRAPADSAASSSPSRAASVDAATAASCRVSSRSARRCSAVSSIENSAGSDGVLGRSRSQCSDCSPSSSRTSTAGARRSSWWPSRRSWQRSTRTPAASSGGYHRAVSSHTQRGRVGLARPRRTPAGRPPSPRAPRRRQRPAPGRPAGARARPGSWAQPCTRRRRRSP